MKTITAKTADIAAIENSIDPYTAEGAAYNTKIRKLAAKMGVSNGEAHVAMVAKQIKFGAIRMDSRFWYPVVDGEIIANGHTFSTGAMSETVHMAGQRGVAVKV